MKYFRNYIHHFVYLYYFRKNFNSRLILKSQFKLNFHYLKNSIFMFLARLIVFPVWHSSLQSRSHFKWDICNNWLTLYFVFRNGVLYSEIWILLSSYFFRELSNGYLKGVSHLFQDWEWVGPWVLESMGAEARGYLEPRISGILWKTESAHLQRKGEKRIRTWTRVFYHVNLVQKS